MKHYLKILICNILYYSGILGLGIKVLCLFKKDFPGVALIYHRFSEDMSTQINPEPTVTHPIKEFEEEIKFITKHFRVFDMNAFVKTLGAEEGFDTPTVTITVDDGARDNYTLMYPILRKYKIPAIIYINTDFLGTNNMIWVDELGVILKDTKKTELILNGTLNKHLNLQNLEAKRISYDDLTQRMKDLEKSDRLACLDEIRDKLGAVKLPKPFMLDWEQVKEMSQNGIDFGAHTCSHPILSRMSNEDAQAEIKQCKETIEEKLGIPCRHFAYPNGRPQDFTEKLRGYCKEIGFESICTAEYGNNYDEDSIWEIRRMGSFLPVSVFAVNLVRCLLMKKREPITYGVKVS